MITCDRCSLEYAGKSVQRLKERFHWHKNNFDLVNLVFIRSGLNTFFNGYVKKLPIAYTILRRLTVKSLLLGIHWMHYLHQKNEEKTQDI